MWYPNVDKDIENKVNSCINCKKVENAPPKVVHHPWAWVNQPMDRVHLDFFGPFHGKTFLIMVDSYSKWCEVEIKTSTTSESTIDTLRYWFSKYGLPRQLVTDNGSQFTSNEFGVFCRMNGIKHVRTAPYHQSSNGQAERFVQTIKRGLERNDIEKGDVKKKLYNYLFAYRSTPSPISGSTPAELFLGHKIRSTLDLMKPESLKLDCPPNLNYFESRFNKRVFRIYENVFVRSFNAKQKWIPGKILRKISEVMYMVKVGDKCVSRHVDQIIHNKTELRELDNDSNDDYEFHDYSFDDPAGPRPCSAVRPRSSTQVRRSTRTKRPVNRYGYN